MENEKDVLLTESEATDTEVTETSDSGNTKKKIIKVKEIKDMDYKLEIVIVVMLGITALFTAWASWVGSLHEGNQASNYADSNNLASEGNSEYNAGVQSMMQDMLLWNEVSDLQIDIIFAQNKGDDETVNTCANKLFYKLNDNLTEQMGTAVGWDWNYSNDDDPTDIILTWMQKEEALVSPFTQEGFTDMYFESANDLLTQSAEAMEEGGNDNTHGDAFGLVTVIYGVVLFLLGIASSFKSTKNKYVIIAISLVSFLIATIYMFTIPLPTGFSITPNCFE